MLSTDRDQLKPLFPVCGSSCWILVCCAQLRGSDDIMALIQITGAVLRL